MRPSKQHDYQVITPRSPERILKRKVVNNQTQYQIKWKGQEEITWEPEDNIRKSLIEEYHQNNSSTSSSLSDKIPVIRQVNSSLKHPNYSEELLLNKQKEMAKLIQGAHPQKTDEIESVHLILTEEQCAFEVRWKLRSDGVLPLSDYYQYEQFKLVSPMLFINFLEVCIVGHENKSNIKFYGPGEDNVQRALLMKKVLLKNPKYVDAVKPPETNSQGEEQKQNLQSDMVIPSKHIISFIQSESKKNNSHSIEQLEKKNSVQVQSQEENNNHVSNQSPVEKPQSQQDQHFGSLSQEPGEIVDQPVQQQPEEQEEQRSLSIEPQRD